MTTTRVIHNPDKKVVAAPETCDCNYGEVIVNKERGKPRVMLTHRPSCTFRKAVDIETVEEEVARLEVQLAFPAPWAEALAAESLTKARKRLDTLRGTA